ncbi:MAG TPA: protein kinase [Candidatus Melainabacteria bacterium]|nr:protein kinase [Candidatus Melainabacteria bacterium]
MANSKSKTTFELARAYPIGATLNSVYSVTGTICSTGRYNLYRARDRRTGRLVTIKELTRAKISKEAQADLFQSEIRALNRARHHNLPLMLDHFSDRGNLYIVFEHVTGMCLGEMLSAEGPLPAELVYPIFLEIAEALYAVHVSGVVHNEITPSSIFLLGDNESAQLAKLTDFGGATIKDDAVQTREPKTFKPEYASPEALKGEQTDERSDIYSVGVVLYMTLTGRLPFSCNDVEELIANQKSGLPRRFKDSAPELNIPFHVEATVFKCLAKEREDRFQNAQELAKWMRSWRHASQQVEAEPERLVAQVEKSYSLDELNAIGTPKVSPLIPQHALVTQAPSKETSAQPAEFAAKPRPEKVSEANLAKEKEATQKAKAAMKEGDTKAKALARQRAKAEARHKADVAAMEKEAAKIKNGTYKKFEFPLYLTAAVMAGVIGFVATVNIRHAFNAKDAEREAFMQQDQMPEVSKRLIAARESIAPEKEQTKVRAVSDTQIPAQPDSQQSSAQDLSQFTGEIKDSGALNQEAPEVPVKPGEPVNFEGESTYKPQPKSSTQYSSEEVPPHTSGAAADQLRSEIRSQTSSIDATQRPRRRAYQTTYY